MAATLLRALALTVSCLALVSPLDAACAIASSPCYPWRIEADRSENVLLEIVPNNVSTTALYRICLCPPAGAVSLIFEFEGKSVVLGSLELGAGETLCRDFRIATARKSRLLLKRSGAASSLIEGCYTTQ